MISRKIEILTILLGIIMLISSTYATTEVLWSDNFNDGNLDGWDVATYYMDCADICPWELGVNTIFNTNNALLFDSSLETGSGIGINFAIHNSNNSYGTWSYDINMMDGTHDGFGFSMSDKSTDFNFTGTATVSGNFTGYALFTVAYYNSGLNDFMPTPGFSLFKWLPNEIIGVGQIEPLANASMADLGIERVGSYHIDITRTTDGNMTVFLDDNKILSAIDNEYNTSEKVMIWSWNGKTSYDNIAVDGKVTSTSSPATTTTSTTSEESFQIVGLLIFFTLIPKIRRSKK